MTHALVIGGGIAGAGTAMALQKAGITATVYESYPQGGDDVGAFLLVMHNGMDALRAIDAAQPVIDASFRTTDVQYIASDDTVFAGGLMGEAHPDPDGPRTLKRADLYRALQEELLRRGGRIEHGKRMVDASVTASGGVVATFADGTQAEGDLLIGADGAWSKTRSLITPDIAPTYTGSNLVYGYSRDPGIPILANTFRMVSGSRGGLVYVTSPEGETYWGAGLSGDPLTKSQARDIDPQVWLDRLIEGFSADSGEIPRRVVGAKQDRVMMTSIYHLASPLPTWHAGPMVLVGDAAHLTGPSAGQGASIALEDGVILAKCLRDLPNLDEACSVYQQLRIERIKQLLNLTQTPVRNLDEAKENAKPSTRAFLYAHEIDWDTPIVTAGSTL